MKKIQKVKVDFKLLLQFFMKLNQRTNKDSHLLFHIKKILISIQNFYIISLRRISNENKISEKFNKLFRNLFNKFCRKIFTCKIVKRLYCGKEKNIYEIFFKKKFPIIYILENLENIFNALIIFSKEYKPLMKTFCFPIIQD